MANELSSNTLRYLIVTFGVFLSAVFWLVVATYPSFFLFNPMTNPSPARAVLLFLMMVAWMVLATGPLVVFCFLAAGHIRPLAALPFIGLTWPVLLIINHVSLAVVEHQWYTGYLLRFPIFIATDVLMPILIVAVWLELRPHDHPVKAAMKRHRA